MKFGIIKERVNPPDQTVVFAPETVANLKQLFMGIDIKVESSDTRAFSDDEYLNNNIEVVKDCSDCELFLGINAVPVDYLIPNKSYFFFSNILKNPICNNHLLQALVNGNNTFYDFEELVDIYNQQLVCFDRYKGIVGAYNSIRAFGIKFELFKLPKAQTLSGKDALISHLKRVVFPPLKFVVSGKGKMANGVKEVLDAIKIKEVSVENYLSKKYSQAVYTQIDVLDYNKRKDGISNDLDDLYISPSESERNFARFANVTDIYIATHSHIVDGSVILSREMLQSKDCKIKIVADITCDFNGSIACTLRAATNAEPFYGYLPTGHKEVDVFHPAAIVVMAVNNLQNELPKEASRDFGEMFSKQVMPAFFNGDKDGVLERAKITENGKLTPRFSYLREYLDAKN